MTGGLHAIIFDFDGVIADSERLHLRSYQDIFAPLGFQLTADTYYTHLLGYDDVGVFRTFARVNGQDWDDETIRRLMAEKTRRYEELTAQGEMLFAGAADFVRQAAARVPIAVASGALTHEIEEILDRADLRSQFIAVVGADQTARSKPSPEPYLEAFARLQEGSGRVLDPRRTVAIEDSKWGLLSARDAGLRLVAVTNTYDAAEFAGLAELIVGGLDALTLAALDELCAGITA